MKIDDLDNPKTHYVLVWDMSTRVRYYLCKGDVLARNPAWAVRFTGVDAFRIGQEISKNHQGEYAACHSLIPGKKIERWKYVSYKCGTPAAIFNPWTGEHRSVYPSEPIWMHSIWYWWAYSGRSTLEDETAYLWIEIGRAQYWRERVHTAHDRARYDALIEASKSRLAELKAIDASAPAELHPRLRYADPQDNPDGLLQMQLFALAA